nr:hypothetical protein StreXyl84_03610 [Streptomyces sp. Xyl84]
MGRGPRRTDADAGITTGPRTGTGTGTGAGTGTGTENGGDAETRTMADADTPEDARKDTGPDAAGGEAGTDAPAGTDGETRPAAGDLPWPLNVRDARLRMDTAEPWTLMVSSFLLSVGLVLCAAVTMPPVWILLRLLGQDPWPSASWLAVCAVGTVVLVTAFTTLCTFLYNVVARCAGGVEVCLDEELRETNRLAPGAGRAPGAYGSAHPLE